MLGSEIITTFELYNGDTTELSSDEELALLNKIYHEVAAIRPWLILNKETTGTVSTSVPYISLPTRFASIAETQIQEDRNKFIFVDDQPVKIVDWAARRNYQDMGGYCYIDLANSRLVFTSQPTVANSYSFDYIEYPADLTLGTSPVFPDRFHPVFPHLMAVDDDILQRFPKNDSYIAEHRARAENILYNMRTWDFNLTSH